jgi:hypothetical protein
MFTVTNMKPEDLEILQEIRGRFQSLKSQRQGEWALIFIFSVMFPIIFLCFFYLDPEQNRWWFAGIVFISLVSSMHIWKERSLEYQFTGEEIIEQRGGKIKNRIQIRDIIDVKIVIRPYKIILKTSNSKMEIQIVPSLNEALLKEANKMNARQSEEEQQREREDAKKKNLTLQTREYNQFDYFFIIDVRDWLAGSLAQGKRNFTVKNLVRNTRITRKIPFASLAHFALPA